MGHFFQIRFQYISSCLAFHGRASDTMGTVGVTRPSPLEKGSKFQSRVSQQEMESQGVFIGFCSPHAMASLNKRTCSF